MVNGPWSMVNGQWSIVNGQLQTQNSGVGFPVAVAKDTHKGSWRQDGFAASAGTADAPVGPMDSCNGAHRGHGNAQYPIPKFQRPVIASEGSHARKGEAIPFKSVQSTPDVRAAHYLTIHATLRVYPMPSA